MSHTKAELEGMSNTELVEIYNKLCPDKTVKKFSDKGTAVKRVLSAQGGGTTQAKGPKQKREPKKKTRFNLEAGKEIIPPKEGTMRFSILELMKKGTTLAGLAAAMKWASGVAESRAAESIRILNRVHGYGFTQNEDGVIKISKQ